MNNKSLNQNTCNHFLKYIQISAFILLLFLISSCRIGKAANNTPLPAKAGNQKVEVSAKGLVNLAGMPNFTPQWLSFRADIDYETQDEKLSLDGTFRIQKDQIIWASLRKFGFEVARIKADSTGISLINRLENSYTILSWSDITKKIGYPLDFQMAQTLLLGNIPGAEQVIWKQNCDSLNCYLDANDAGVAYHLKKWKQLPEPYQLIMSSQSASASLDAVLKGILDLGKTGSTATQRFYQFKKQDIGSLKLSLKMDEFEIDQIQKMPFAIPASYQELD